MIGYKKIWASRATLGHWPKTKGTAYQWIDREGIDLFLLYLPNVGCKTVPVSWDPHDRFFVKFARSYLLNN